jgi:hypothetical protein
MTVFWKVRTRPGEALRLPAPRPAPPPALLRPGIASRWKPRDRLSAAGS